MEQRNGRLATNKKGINVLQSNKMPLRPPPKRNWLHIENAIDVMMSPLMYMCIVPLPIQFPVFILPWYATKIGHIPYAQEVLSNFHCILTVWTRLLGHTR